MLFNIVQLSNYYNSANFLFKGRSPEPVRIPHTDDRERDFQPELHPARSVSPT